MATSGIHPDYPGLVREYEDLYRVGRGAVRDSARLAALAERLVPLAHDDYHRAMWLRRAWLHRQGRDGEIYSGDDARRWKQSLGRATPPGFASRRAT